MFGFIVLFLVCLPLMWSHMFTFFLFKYELHHLTAWECKAQNEPAPVLTATLILKHFKNVIWLGCNLPLDGQDSSVWVLCAPVIVSSRDK